MKKIAVVLGLALGLLFLPGQASAQNVIDGREHPEQISDATAYRLVLSHYSNILADPKVAPEVKAELFLMLNMSAEDEQVLRSELSKFKIARDQKIAKFNEGAHEKLVKGLDADSYGPDADDLVQQTRNNLTAQFSKDGAQKFNAHVQQLKSRIKVVTGLR